MEALLSDVIWIIVIGGWIFLIAAGLEADKPLSGGIPGHVDHHEHLLAPPETLWDRLGIMGAWAIFGLASVGLVFVLWWIFAVHPG